MQKYVFTPLGAKTMLVDREGLDFILLSNAGYGNARQPMLEAVYANLYQDGTPAEALLTMDGNLV